ncbi:hypothetical protein ACS0TY_017339 [Phlomoides rotata]
MDPLPGNFKALIYEYDGMSDPHDHLLIFENGALLHQYTDGYSLTNGSGSYLRILFTRSLRSKQYSCTNLRVQESS